MFKRIVFSLISIPLLIGISLKLSIEIWDKIFLVGLMLFMIGGLIFIVKKGIFDNFLRVSKEFRKKTSKLEAYVSGEELPTAKFKVENPKRSFGNYILLAGVIFITISTAFSYYLS